jgi:manganese-dependent inorganic pyrophosphatase
LVGGEVEKALATKAFGKDFTSGKAVLPGVVSRKKQMVPPLEKAAA